MTLTQLTADQIKEIRDEPEEWVESALFTPATVTALCTLALDALELRAKLERAHKALRLYQEAVASCLMAGGVVLDADGAPSAWWEAMITAQQKGARDISILKKDK